MAPPILLTRAPDAGRHDLETYRAEGGYRALERLLADGDHAAVVDQVEKAQLRGRGGAAFAVARKWRLALQQPGPRVLVANGGEHEPGSEKDRYLVANYPHTVLEGIQIAALATGADHAWLYLIEDMAAPIEAAEAALAEAREAGLLTVPTTIHRAPTTYVAGEETAAIDSIDGGPGKPRKKPPYPGEQGVGGRPTTVNNVETLAHLPFLLREGAEAYAAIGTAESKGTMLFTLGGQVQRPGVYELPFGSTYRHLLESCGGGLRSGSAVRAILPATSARFLPAGALDLPIAHETLASAGSGPGCGGVRFVEEGEDPVAITLGLARFFMDEQCGQCPPCRMETNQFVHVLTGVQDGKGLGYQQKLEQLAKFARGKGHCSLIEMAAAPVLSALEVFADEFARASGGGAGADGSV